MCEGFFEILSLMTPIQSATYLVTGFSSELCPPASQPQPHDGYFTTLDGLMSSGEDALWRSFFFFSSSSSRVRRISSRG